jgi:hypothetical protein
VHYKLLGFSQNGSVRQFSFERVGTDTTPATFAVRADIMLARNFKLALQELPSLCSRLLENCGEAGPAGTMCLTEAEMSVHAAANAALADEEAAKRAIRSRRGALAMAARASKSVAP